MGNSGEDPAKGISVSVGGLVWVRRRNGSWWPGRILSPDELPEGCIPTPRSGTPVKLLGRDDASVDWYNLEKSKRVKAFRCGEYDDCIEKAKALAFHSSKKAVKYARREDAILHALEIENAHLAKDCPDVSSVQNVKEEEQHHDEETKDINEHLGSAEDLSDSAPEISHSGVSFEEPNHLRAVKEERKRWRTPNDSEDDGNEGTKRMRGLEDLGMGVSSSHRRKRSQVAHVHEFLKRKSRRRPLAKVLECTAMLSVPVACEPPSGPTGSSVPGFESNEAKINNSVVVNNNSDSTGVSCENGMSLNISGHLDASLRSKLKENEISSELGILENGSDDRLFNVPPVSEDKHSAGLSTCDASASQKPQIGTGPQSSQSSHVETLSLGNEDHNETGSTSSAPVDVGNITQSTEQGTSKWQLKGKRNSRSRKTDLDDEAETFTQRDILERDRSGNIDSNRVGGSLITDTQVEEFRGWSWNTPQKESQAQERMPAPPRQLPYRQSRLIVNPKYDSSDFSLRHHAAGSGLYDVDVEVKTSYRPQGVPYISLMSKLHSQPIIGHPLQIEVLDDGFCNDILMSEVYSSSEFDYNLNNASILPSDFKRKRKGRPPSKNRLKARRNGTLSKKTRKLSSLTGPQKQSQERKKAVVDKIKGPSIACIPLNVVFSRINAALNGSSIRPAPRTTTGSVEIGSVEIEHVVNFD